MKQLKKGIVGLVAAAVLITLAACGNTSSTEDTQSGENSVDAVEEKVVGVAPGPYGDMVTEVISPLLEEKGYQLTTKMIIFSRTMPWRMAKSMPICFSIRPI